MADLTPQDAGPQDTVSEGAERASGKERGARIRLDHYKGWDGPTTFKWLGAAAAAMIGLAVAGWALFAPGGGSLASHGPLSEPHALWTSQCNACHAPGVPLRVDSVALGDVSAVSEHRCQGCHAVSNHHGLPPDSDPTCASCHQEHRGAEADIRRVADQACTDCHADIAAAAPGAPPTIENVTAFPGNHPEFRGLPADRDGGDPGTLGFSHSRHMTLGLTTSADSRASEVFRYSRLPTDLRDRYLADGRDENAPVQLDCSSCHELPGRGAEGRSDSFAAATGGAFLPVRYDRHCQACHPLSSSANPAGAELPHGLRGAELEAHLRRELRSQWLDDTDDNFLATPVRRVPGRSRVLRDKAESVLSEIERKLAAATGHVSQQCQKCHELTGDGLEVQPTGVPDVWLPKAWFDHRAHRSVACTECHPRAAAASSGLALTERKRESDAVMIPTKDNCVQCHAPKTEAGGGVRHDCALCHRYHEAGEPPAAFARWAESDEPRTIERFLHAFPNEQAAE